MKQISECSNSFLALTPTYRILHSKHRFIQQQKQACHSVGTSEYARVHVRLSRHRLTSRKGIVDTRTIWTYCVSLGSNRISLLNLLAKCRILLQNYSNLTLHFYHLYSLQYLLHLSNDLPLLTQQQYQQFHLNCSDSLFIAPIIISSNWLQKYHCCCYCFQSHRRAINCLLDLRLLALLLPLSLPYWWCECLHQWFHQARKNDWFNLQQVMLDTSYINQQDL